MNCGFAGPMTFNAAIYMLMLTYKYNKRNNRIVTIPNALSCLRILLTPFMLYYLSREDGHIEILVLLLVAVVSDFFDGFLARKLDQISNLGKILDPLADKVVVVTLCVGLVFFRDFPLWALSLIIFRDVVILLSGLYIVRKRAYVPMSNILGKITVNMYALLILVYIFDIEPLKNYVLLLSVIFLIISLYVYYYTEFVQTKS